MMDKPISKFEFNVYASDKGILVYDGDNPLMQGVTLNPNFKVTDEAGGVDAIAITQAYVAYLTDMVASGDYVINQNLLYRPPKQATAPKQTAPQAPNAPSDDDMASLGSNPSLAQGEPITNGMVKMAQEAIDKDGRKAGQKAKHVTAMRVGLRTYSGQDSQQFLRLDCADGESFTFYNRWDGKSQDDVWKNPFSLSKMHWDKELLKAAWEAANSGRDVNFEVDGIITVAYTTGQNGKTYTNFKGWTTLGSWKQLDY